MAQVRRPARRLRRRLLRPALRDSRRTEVAEALSSLRAVGALAADAVLVVASARAADRLDLAARASRPLRDRAYGEAHLWIGGVEAALGRDSA